jgi:hypothetical protein
MCYFQKNWTQTFTWVREDPKNSNNACCHSCNTTFSLSNMGRGALVSHENGSKHKNIMALQKKQQPISQMFVIQQEVPHVTSTRASEVSERIEVPSPRINETGSGNPPFVIADATTKAELLWAMKTVVSHSSFNSADGSAELLANMFPDSQIAKNMKIASTKMTYVINYGLATYFRERLQDVLSKADLFVICFDEALNKVAQRGQMDLAVRYYMKNEEKEEVVTQYLNSAFLGKASANDLLTKFKEGMSGLPMSKILQVSMDGPNVNWAFLRLLKEDLLSLDSEAAALLELGCCGLHVIHGAFQTGHTKATWNVNQILTAAYYVFKDSPARRADYTNLTDSTCFPQKFCR